MSDITLDQVPDDKRDESMPAMSFFEHLEELRKRLVYCAIAVAVGFGVCWAYKERIYGFVQKPIIDAFAHNGMSSRLTFLNPIEPFNLYLKTAFMGGLFLTSPFLLYQVWMFISPGLYRKEKRYVVPFMLSTVSLFLSGGYFGYRLVFPQALQYLIELGKDFTPMITIGEYTELFLTVILGLGAVFELPILVFFLALMGVVSAGWMWRNIRYAILVIFIIASILAPTPDISTMCIFAAPMIVLYLISIGIAWRVHPDQRKARQARA
ncbi:MAG TPA: twin-arginine translocase subunit TatC [Candidatus Kapabacteria bacterium]|nr:twin-arginine translocase subunit TatC [Candidatus Kapabacteria bacterium]